MKIFIAIEESKTIEEMTIVWAPPVVVGNCDDVGGELVVGADVGTTVGVGIVPSLITASISTILAANQFKLFCAVAW